MILTYFSAVGDAEEWKVPFEKDFYNPSRAIVQADPEMVKKFQRDHEIALVKGAKLPNPLLNFGDGNFPERVLREFENQGFRKPTPIQAQASCSMITADLTYLTT